MSDILNRLRWLARESYEMRAPLTEAANELERLGALSHATIVERNRLLRDNERLRAALLAIKQEGDKDFIKMRPGWMAGIAKEALGDE